ncbi:alpha/beta fold hydrolase [Actinopolymorpha pittospori]|uniref:Pimeloyl-ACP methyl ester carboxylesterase n=1 Tax=Actinopolymorpha pittospori TaxID=648752 RepID=A0A927R5M7_9ACTN|nr:alpha/beta hydrolase [Actinopolymorpha pittospori]MBE1603467.1 pimeloyl-ACP methyl ester carboxylesterase [Actinopolymorpha pittospori]
MGRPGIAAERETAVARLDAGVVEYRLDRRGETSVLVFHGGHMRAGLPLGEEVFAELGCTVLVPSRPGYGRTPVGTGRSPAGFADASRELCRHLGIEGVAAVVGVSAGGRTAMAMAARHPELVRRLILQSSVGFLPWPDPRTRLMASVAFNPVTERATWAAVAAMMRHVPALGLRTLVGDLSSEPVNVAFASLGTEHRDLLRWLFSRMRSGRGFRNDLRQVGTDGLEISQPTLVVASRKDGSVPFAHAESLVARIPNAVLVASEAASHFIWLGSDYPAIAEQISRFVAS